LLRDAARDRRTRVAAVAVVFAAVALVHALYVVRVGGDFMHVRLLMPAIFAFVAPVAVVPLRRNVVVAVLVAGWSFVALVGFARLRTRRRRSIRRRATR
jgi:arabinofuranosyltransferase